MTTTPTSSPSEQIVTTIKSDYNWVSHHLLALAITGVLVVASVYGVESLEAKHAAANDARWNQILTVQQQQTAALQSKLTADEVNWQQVISQLSAQNTTLQAAILQRDKALVVQQKQDATLSASDAAQRLAQQTKAAPGEVTAQGDNLVVDLPISRQVVSNLDLLPAVQNDLADTKKQLANEVTIASNLSANAEELKQVNAGLVKQNQDQVKACEVDKALLRAQARKSKLKWFGLGFIAGFITGHIY